VGGDTVENQTGNARESLCLVDHGFYPFATNVKREAETLLEDGFDVHVVCLRGKEEAKHEIVEGVQVHRLPAVHGSGRVRRYLLEHNVFYVLAGLKLMALDLGHRFRIIQVNSIPVHLVFSTLVPRLAGAKVVLRVHEPSPERFEAEFDAWYCRVFVGAIRHTEKLSLK
jgi:hypothetical protein